jgi:uracil-DNA glycosylase
MSKITIDLITRMAAKCEACELHGGRIQPAFSKGDLNAGIIICGMCPGPDENLAGVPFVGRAGQILDRVIMEAFYKSSDDIYNGIYITNLIKCFVAPGIPLQKDWMDTCLPYFVSELGLIPANRLILLGKDVCNYLLNTDEKIGALRGKEFKYMGVKTICSYHPSYVVRSGGERSKEFGQVVEDFKRIF